MVIQSYIFYSNYPQQHSNFTLITLLQDLFLLYNNRNKSKSFTDHIY